MRSSPSGRPYARDIKDLFSTLMGKSGKCIVAKAVSLPLSVHRSRFKSFPFSFTSEEAVTNLGSLKFSQTNRMQDPKDGGRLVSTTTTTTFSMVKEMATSVCQKFLDARFLECSTDKEIVCFKQKCIWQLTSKGIQILQRFVRKNGIIAEVPKKLINSNSSQRCLAILERNEITDELSRDRAMIELIFRHFANSFTTYTQAPIQIGSDDCRETSGNSEDEKRRLLQRQSRQLSCSGHDIVLWLMDCCTIVDRSEPPEIAALFLQNELIASTEHLQICSGSTESFSSARSSIYTITDLGKEIAGWLDHKGLVNDNNISSVLDVSLSRTTATSELVYRETNVAKLRSLLSNTALRSEFRQFLCQNFCEENLSFWLDCDEFRRNMQNVLESNSRMRDILAMSYTIYNTFLAPGAPCELNLDHVLRHEIATQMARPTTGHHLDILTTLRDIAALFWKAQDQCFKLMAAVRILIFPLTNDRTQFRNLSRLQNDHRFWLKKSPFSLHTGKPNASRTFEFPSRD